jgi:hypothetical protein
MDGASLPEFGHPRLNPVQIINYFLLADLLVFAAYINAQEDTLTISVVCPYDTAVNLLARRIPQLESDLGDAVFTDHFSTCQVHIQSGLSLIMEILARKPQEKGTFACARVTQVNNFELLEAGSIGLGSFYLIDFHFFITCH